MQVLICEKYLRVQFNAILFAFCRFWHLGDVLCQKGEGSISIKWTRMVTERIFNIKLFFCFFCFFRATPSAYGGSQARGQIWAVAAGLHHSHSNMGSKPRLRPTPQLTATTRSLTHWEMSGIQPALLKDASQIHCRWATTGMTTLSSFLKNKQKTVGIFVKLLMLLDTDHFISWHTLDILKPQRWLKQRTENECTKNLDYNYALQDLVFHRQQTSKFNKNICVMSDDEDYYFVWGEKRGKEWLLVKKKKSL